MRYGEERSPQSSTSGSLEVNVIFFETGRIWENLIPKVMNGYSWGYSTNSRAYRVFNKRTEIVMESINVVSDDEEIEASSKGEDIQPIPEELPTPSADMVKPSSSTQETLVIPSVAESPPDPSVNVTFGNNASASEDEDESTNPPKRSLVKLNHPSQQLIGNLEEGRRLRKRVIQPSTEVANQVSYNCYPA